MWTRNLLPDTCVSLTEKYGLEELASTSELISKLDVIGEKEWFRKQMGMQKGAVHSRSNTPSVRAHTSVRLIIRVVRCMTHFLSTGREWLQQSLKGHFHI